MLGPVDRDHRRLVVHDHDGQNFRRSIGTKISALYRVGTSSRERTERFDWAAVADAQHGLWYAVWMPVAFLLYLVFSGLAA